MSAGVGTAKSWLPTGPKWLRHSRASSKLLLSIVKTTNSCVANMSTYNQHLLLILYTLYHIALFWRMIL